MSTETECKYKSGFQIFSQKPQFISVGGNVTTNQQVANTTGETVVLTESFFANLLSDTTMCFEVVLGGEISSTGTGDCTLTLRYGTSDILALATASLADEDDKPFKLAYTGHILTAGASGKVLCTAQMDVGQGTHLTFMSDTANTGATVDLTADGAFNVTAHWDAASADNDIIVTHGWVKLYN